MSFDRLPSKAEVMGWSQHHLADYMKKVSLSDQGKVLMMWATSGLPVSSRECRMSGSGRDGEGTYVCLYGRSRES